MLKKERDIYHGLHSIVKFLETSLTSTLMVHNKSFPEEN